MTKIIIAGGRDFNDKDQLYFECNNLIRGKGSGLFEIEIVSGTASGADKMGEEYSNTMGLQLKKFPADWDKYGKSAGYKRNKQMAEYADVLIAFWDGKSRGTKHMIDLALEHGLEVHIYRY